MSDERRVIDVCALDDIEDGAARGFELPDARYDGFVVRRCGCVYAWLNVCPHAGNPLHWKPDAFLTRSGELIMCSVHGAIFEIDSGRCVGGPCPGKFLTGLEAHIVDGRVQVTYTVD